MAVFGLVPYLMKNNSHMHLESTPQTPKEEVKQK